MAEVNQCEKTEGIIYGEKESSQWENFYSGILNPSHIMERLFFFPAKMNGYVVEPAQLGVEDYNVMILHVDDCTVRFRSERGRGYLNIINIDAEKREKVFNKLEEFLSE